MRKTHPKYRIKADDNLKTISNRFGIEQSIWTRYHNNMCCLDDVIRDHLLPDLKEIYLLPELWDKADALNSMPSAKELLEKKINQHIRFGYQNTLPMKRYPEILTYNIALTLQKESIVNTIKYQIGIKWLDLKDEYHIIEINKISATYINNREPDLMADELAVKVSAVFYPLELIVTQAKGIIGINNFPLIQKRWQNIRQNIKDYYNGETLDKYLSLNDKVLQTKDRLLNSLRNDWFLHTYFNNIYQTYGSDYSFSNTIPVPFVFDADGVEYTVKQEIDNTVDDKGFIHINMNGEVSDQRSQTDLDNALSYARYSDDNTPMKGVYNAQYQIDARFNTISEAVLNCDLMLENYKRTTVIIKQVKK